MHPDLLPIGKLIPQLNFSGFYLSVDFCNLAAYKHHFNNTIFSHF